MMDIIDSCIGWEHLDKVTIRVEQEGLLQQLQYGAAIQKEIISYCVDTLGAAKDKTLAFDLHTMTEDLSLSVDQLRRALAALHNSGSLEYRAPFRGRGLRILQRVPVSRL